jgi:beta-lactamase class A
MNKKLRFLVSVLCIAIVTPAIAQQNKLRSQIQQIAKQIDGTVGVAMLNFNNHDTLSLNGTSRMVMHSVIKFPLAMAMLHQVDEGKFKLNQLITISKADLSKLYSPIRDKYPNGTKLPLNEILGYMVSLSDNTACDLLIKLLGGTQNIEAYIHSLGVKGIAIKATEAQVAGAWPVQYTNWCQPLAGNQLLGIMHKGTKLSKTSNAFLWKIMLATTTAPHRLKGLLPAGAKVAHKSGTSPVNEKGLAAATNDVGILILPNGKKIALSVFITDSMASEAKRESVIAQIAKAVWDNYK